MTRKEYIEKLETVRSALINLHADFTALQITDETDIEASRRKTAGGLFDKLNTLLYENGAVSLRIMDDNTKAGRGEQGDLFDEARRESAANGDQAEAVEFTPAEEKPKTATKTIGLCRFMADGVNGPICTLEPNYGKPCDGLDTECENHDEKPAKKSAKKSAKKGGK